MAVLLLGVSSVKAQCTITTSGPPCVNQPIQFFCNTTGASNYNWDFNSEGANTSLCNPSFAFSTTGTKTITLSLKLANGSTCNATTTIVVKGAPVIDFVKLSDDTSCFFGNSFCFRDDTKPVDNGGCIKSIKYVWSDGELITVSGTAPTGVTMPNSFCKSFTNPAGGTYDLLIETEDCNGCISRKTFLSICVVRASMGLTFSSLRPKACDSVKLTVTNASLIDIKDIDSFRWDWGDSKFTSGKGGTGAPNWKTTVSHMFYTQGPNAGEFNTKLTVWSKFGCKESFTFFSSATNLKLDPQIIASFDSVCYDDPVIDFTIKGGVIPQGVSPVFNYGDPDSGPLNITRQWVGNHSFTKSGPFKIKFTYNHPICGNREIYDTILVIGPESKIEKAFNWLVDSLRYQCVIKDTVKFKNFSVFYHNDRKFRDDDSTFVFGDSLLYDVKKDTIILGNPTFDRNYMVWLKPGFNAPLTHIFNSKSGQTSVDAAPANQRGNSCIFRVWDFDDDFCEKCTTDTKNGINTVLKNCKFSKDSLPQHWYTPWDSIYQTRNSTRAANGIRYNKDSGLCIQTKIWPDDSMAIIRYTTLYYGNNVLGKKAKDSLIYAGIKNKVMVPSFIAGPARWDATSEAPRFYLGRTDTMYLDNNNGITPNMIRGLRYQTVQIGQSLILKSKTDTAFFNYWIVDVLDTIANDLVRPWHNVVSRMKMQGYNATDSLDPALHRQKFYEGTTVRCFNVRLFQKDMCHALACENQATAQLALMPPSAKKLRKDGMQCLGGSQDNYGITFILSDTKPGCTRTYAQINYDTALSKFGWVDAIGPNLAGGSIATGNLPPVNPPYLGYDLGGPAPSRFSKQFTTDDFKDSLTGYINVGLIVGTGMWRTPNDPPIDDLNYPATCIDTVYYPKFARFPVLDNRFRIIKPKQGPEFTKICRKDTLCMTLMPRNRSYIPDVEELNWSLSAANVGKYFDKYYTMQVNEYYERFAKNKNNPSDTNLYDYLHHKSISYFDGKNSTLDSQVIQVAKIVKWHTEADITPVFDQIKQILIASNIDIYDLSPTQLSEIIWNGQGAFGKPYTGSRGCLDTTGYGKFIRFYKVKDSSVITHFRDTSLLPLNKVVGFDGLTYNAYCFVPQYSGFYFANFGLRSRAPENCVMQTGSAKKVIVGFYGRMDYTDTILCHGEDVSAYTEFKYFDAYPEITNRLLDPTDYWYDRRSEAGNQNREGRTRWDLSKDDDTLNPPNTVFGPFPYGQTGVGTGSFPAVPPGVVTHLVKLGGLSVPGAIYYLSDTGGYYQVRVTTADSLGCRDTFPQDIFVTAANAFFKLDQNRPECATVIEFFDSSYVFDPCVWKLKDKCDYITKWIINWGDSSKNKISTFRNFLPPQIGHDYVRNGRFKVTLRVETYLGCWDTFSRMIYIPGPVPFFDTFIPRKYCVNERVDFSNLSTYMKQDSSIWLWDFGDGFYDSQFDTIIPGKNDTISHRYTKPGRYKIFLRQNFVLNLGGTIKKCFVTYPDTLSEQPIFYIDVYPYDSVKLKISRTEICENDTVELIGMVKPTNKYQYYRWHFGVTPTDTLITQDTSYLDDKAKRYVDKGRYVIKFMGDRNTVNTTEKVCPGEDSVILNVANVKADFEIDTTKSPIFCFENKSLNSTNHAWSLYNKEDIMLLDPADRKVVFDGITGSEANDPKPCRDYRDSVGEYWVCLEAINDIGCRDTTCRKLVNRFEASIRPPNVFTPDNGAFQGTDKEGLKGNDVFNIEIKGEDLYDLVIYDRWGVKVFDSKDKNVDWNGKINNTGAECPNGTYYYILNYRYKGKDKKEPVLNGTVQIIRG
ncbi:MAG: gliding motility-associated C-terminal domain-containing protein [Bacteroidota bacterium]